MDSGIAMTSRITSSACHATSQGSGNRIELVHFQSVDRGALSPLGRPDSSFPVAQLWVPAIAITRPIEVCPEATVRRQPF